MASAQWGGPGKRPQMHRDVPRLLLWEHYCGPVFWGPRTSGKDAGSRGGSTGEVQAWLSYIGGCDAEDMVPGDGRAQSGATRAA